MVEMTAYLVTGANKGIGRGVVEVLLSQPNVTVIAAVRDPGSADSTSLSELSIHQSSKLITVKINSVSAEDAKEAVELLKSGHGIQKLDTVIASAGIVNSLEPAIRTPVEKLQEHFDVNTVGPIRLFQAAWPLLEVASNPRFIVMSSSIGSIEDMEPVPSLAYGCSKAAVNYFVRKVHFEHPTLTAVAIHPGWVQTGMGSFAAKAWGASGAPMTVEQSVEGVLQQIKASSRETTSGTFVSYDGQKIHW